MIFLTSTGFRNPAIFNILRRNRGSDYPGACVIVTGLPEKKNHPLAKNSVKFLSDQKIADILLLDVEREDPSVLLDYELIFILGGNSAHLFYHLKESGAAELILRHVEQEKDIIGASAGAWFLSSGRFADDFSFLGIDESYPHKVDSKGLNLIKANLFPHYDMFLEKVEDLEEELLNIERKKQISFIRLRNLDYIYRDNCGNIHNVVNE